MTSLGLLSINDKLQQPQKPCFITMYRRTVFVILKYTFLTQFRVLSYAFNVVKGIPIILDFSIFN